jgi:hypothetical protein
VEDEESVTSLGKNTLPSMTTAASARAPKATRLGGAPGTTGR